MGCFHSKGQASDTAQVSAQQVNGSKRSRAVVKFVPDTYEYTGLTAVEIDQLLSTDRTVEELSIRNLKTWANVVYVYDGDSCHIVINHNGDEIKLKCRVYGIDTPELRTSNPLEKEHGIRARDRFSELTDDRLVWVNILNDNDDKYGRYLVKFFMDSKEEHAIDKILINEGYGYEYYGDTKLAFDDWYNP